VFAELLADKPEKCARFSARRPQQSRRTQRPSRLAAHVTEVLSAAADQAVTQKLMPVAVGLDAAVSTRPRRCSKSSLPSAPMLPLVPQLKRRELDGKADVLFLDSRPQGATLDRRPAESAGSRDSAAATDSER
jgi:hypothetical protein